MKVPRVIFVVSMMLGVLWDCLCLTGVVTPFTMWRFSFTIVAFGTICILLPRIVQKSEHREVSRSAASFVVVWYFAWIITVLACLVYNI
jgi:hypothetical protein